MPDDLTMTVIEDRIESSIDTCTMLEYTEAENRNVFLFKFIGQTFGRQADAEVYRMTRRVFESHMREAGLRVRTYDHTHETRERVLAR